MPAASSFSEEALALGSEFARGYLLKMPIPRDQRMAYLHASERNVYFRYSRDPEKIVLINRAQQLRMAIGFPPIIGRPQQWSAFQRIISETIHRAPLLSHPYRLGAKIIAVFAKGSWMNSFSELGPDDLDLAVIMEGTGDEIGSIVNLYPKRPPFFDAFPSRSVEKMHLSIFSEQFVQDEIPVITGQEDAESLANSDLAHMFATGFPLYGFQEAYDWYANLAKLSPQVVDHIISNLKLGVLSHERDPNYKSKMIRWFSEIILLLRAQEGPAFPWLMDSLVKHTRISFSDIEDKLKQGMVTYQTIRYVEAGVYLLDQRPKVPHSSGLKAKAQAAA